MQKIIKIHARWFFLLNNFFFKHVIKKFEGTLNYSTIVDNHKETRKGMGFLVFASFYTDLGL